MCRSRETIASVDRHDTRAQMDISTICIRGLPDDLKRREVRNLVCFMPGFEGISISRGDPASAKPTIGFAKFSAPAEAMGALNCLNGHVFDEEMQPARPLVVEMARRDLDNVRGSSSAPRRAPDQQLTSRLVPLGAPAGYGYGMVRRVSLRARGWVSGRSGGRGDRVGAGSGRQPHLCAPWRLPECLSCVFAATAGLWPASPSVPWGVPQGVWRRRRRRPD